MQTEGSERDLAQLLEAATQREHRQRLLLSQVTASAKEELARSEERHREEMARMEASAAVAAAAMEKEQNAQIETIRNLRWVVSKESVALVVESAGTTTPHNPATDPPAPALADSC